MFDTAFQTILSGIKSTKTIMASFILTYIIVIYFGMGDVPDKKSIEFGLNFLVVFCISFLSISFIMWTTDKIRLNFKTQDIESQKNEKVLEALETLTTQEKSLLANLVKRGDISGTVDIPDDDANVINHLSRLGILKINFIDSVGPYRLQFRYRYQINKTAFEYVSEILAQLSKTITPTE